MKPTAAEILYAGAEREAGIRDVFTDRALTLTRRSKTIFRGLIKGSMGGS